jgi:hypothetical protein
LIFSARASIFHRIENIRKELPSGRVREIANDLKGRVGRIPRNAISVTPKAKHTTYLARMMVVVEVCHLSGKVFLTASAKKMLANEEFRSNDTDFVWS